MTYEGPPIEFRLELLTLALRNNYFRFEERWYLQIAGTSMGAAMAPMYANAYMYIYEQQWILSKFGQYIQGYFRYIDALSILWGGSVWEASDMVQHLNQLESPIRFTSNISTTSVQFLDLEISVKEQRIPYSLYTTLMHRNTILHNDSAHPGALKKSFPRAQFLRVIHNNSERDVVEQQLKEMMERFLVRGYRWGDLLKELDEAKSACTNKMVNKAPRMVFPMNFNDVSPMVSRVIKENWKMLSSDYTLPKIFKELPLS
ncbi:Hypothetical predicted protein [Pelobates cultripes]|uniref:Helix-turn-helix domain-containing protein n=1 Tax=Pelobates cultripes TaxID=61616 RepID=A0AAD1RLJ6_PELCU|nr:Hypothetical predicted protein [Pelobates cultripes]